MKTVLVNVPTWLRTACCFQLIVITHGWQANRQFPPWVVDLAQAMNQNLPAPAVPADVANAVVDLQGNIPSTSQFILFDWAKLSRQPGMANQDMVAGRLCDIVRVRLAQERAAGRAPVDIHFIGHSRGAYVNAEVIRRLRQQGASTDIKFLQMTVLDAVQVGFDGDLTANPGGIVDWTHNYYQRGAGLVGKKLTGAFNVDLTYITRVWGGRAGNLNAHTAHAETHDWFHWLFDRADIAGIPNVWGYRDLEVAGQYQLLAQERQLGQDTTRTLLHRGTVLCESFNDPALEGCGLFGVAQVAGQELQLTPSQAEVAGSAFFQRHFQGDFTAEFMLRMADPTPEGGADGLTFAAVNVGQQDVGEPGGQLGYGGLSGFAVAFDTHFNFEYADPLAPALRVGVRLNGEPRWHRLNNVALPEPLNSGNPFLVRITLRRRFLNVLVYSFGKDRHTQLCCKFSKDLELPKRKMLGFTAATGTGAQRHLIDNVIIVPIR